MTVSSTLLDPGLTARRRAGGGRQVSVEFAGATAINTHVAVIAAAVELFRSLGAAEVIIGEGPGHRRDTMGLAEDADYRRGIEKFDSLFVDLNRDDVSAVRGFGDLPEIISPTRLCGPIDCLPGQDEDPSLGRSDALHEELLWRGPRRSLRLAEKPASPGRYRPFHRRAASGVPAQFRHRGRHRRDGGQWADTGIAKSSGVV